MFTVKSGESLGNYRGKKTSTYKVKNPKQIIRDILYTNIYIYIIYTGEPRHSFIPFPNQQNLNIPKHLSESVYRKRTDDTMANRKKDKRTNND